MSTTATPVQTVGLVMEPLDVLFFRDGRPFEQASYATSRPMPLPQTVAGAVWTALMQQHGCDFQRLANNVRSGATLQGALANQGLEFLTEVSIQGPWLAVQHQERLHLLFAPPAHWRCCNSRLVALRPVSSQLLGWKSTYSAEQELRPLWFYGQEELEKLPFSWVPWNLMAKMLQCSQIALEEVAQCFEECGLLRSGKEVKDWSDLAQRLPSFILPDRRTGIGLNSQTGTVQQGMIYSAEFLSLLWRPQQDLQCALYVEVSLPQEKWPKEIKTLHLGGEMRHVRVVPKWFSAWESLRVEVQPKHKPYLVLTTPALCSSGWLPQALEGVVEAAAVSGYEAVSGWDLVRGGPKPSRFALPAGSVFFLKQQLQSLPKALSDDSLDQQQGWGCYLQGVWNDD